MGITVIMASYLGEYPGSRSNPVQKFIRAVKSFQEQTLKEKQLIIVSDGCGLTNATYEDLFKSDPQITLIRFEKQEGWPGPLREAARSIAKYEWIMYLDSDDFILYNYLESVYNELDDNFDFFKIKNVICPIDNGILTDRQITYFGKGIIDVVNYKKEQVDLIENKYKPVLFSSKEAYGVNTIIHNNKLYVRWEKYIDIGGGEDVIFIKKLTERYEYKDIKSSGYVLCHYCYYNNDVREIIWDF